MRSACCLMVSGYPPTDSTKNFSSLSIGARTAFATRRHEMKPICVELWVYEETRGGHHSCCNDKHVDKLIVPIEAVYITELPTADSRPGTAVSPQQDTGEASVPNRIAPVPRMIGV